MIVPRAACWRSVRPFVSIRRVESPAGGFCVVWVAIGGGPRQCHVERAGTYQRAATRRAIRSRRVRLLAVGNMYPPHHLGGYELIWQAAMSEAIRRGHAVRVATTDFRRP